MTVYLTQFFSYIGYICTALFFFRFCAGGGDPIPPLRKVRLQKLNILPMANDGIEVEVPVDVPVLPAVPEPQLVSE